MNRLWQLLLAVFLGFLIALGQKLYNEQVVVLRKKNVEKMKRQQIEMLRLNADLQKIDEYIKEGNYSAVREIYYQAVQTFDNRDSILSVAFWKLLNSPSDSAVYYFLSEIKFLHDYDDDIEFDSLDYYFALANLKLKNLSEAYSLLYDAKYEFKESCRIYAYWLMTKVFKGEDVNSYDYRDFDELYEQDTADSLCTAYYVLFYAFRYDDYKDLLLEKIREFKNPFIASLLMDFYLGEKQLDSAEKYVDIVRKGLNKIKDYELAFLYFSYVDLAEYFLALNETDSAIKYLNALYEKYPNSYVISQLGDIYFSNGRWEEALAAYSEYAEMYDLADTTRKTVYYKMAQCWKQLGNIEEYQYYKEKSIY